MAELNALRDAQETAGGRVQDSSAGPQAGRYARFIVRFPYIPPIIVMAVVGLGAGLALHLHPLPTFADPTEGFGTPSSEISKRARTLQYLHHTVNRGDTYRQAPHPHLVDKQWGLDIIANASLNIREKRDSKQNIPNPSRSSQMYAHCSTEITDPELIKFVFESKKKDSLFRLESIKAMCELEERVIAPYIMNKWNLKPEESCPMVSLPFYMSVLYDKPCQDMQEKDLQNMFSLLSTCTPYYQNGMLKKDCTSVSCPQIPEECIKYTAVYNIIYYLTDREFLQQGKPGNLKYALYMYNWPEIPGSWLYFYKHVFEENDPSNKVVFISSMYAKESLKYEVFNECLASDIKYFGFAMALVLLIMLVYLRSIVLMVATVFNVVFSFILAYAVYVLVLRISVFPFINVLAVLILIAIGADDVFIFHDALEQAKLSGNDISLDLALDKALNHAALSIFVTSLTTSAAFFANFISNIVALKSFGIFTGSAVLVNLVLMLTWTPSMIIGVDKCFSSCFSKKKKWLKCQNIMSNMSKFLCGKVLSPVVNRCWFVWVPMLLVVGIASLVVILYKPGLKLPQSAEMQLMQASHPLEKWDLSQKKNFHFVSDEMEKLKEKIYLSFLWGANPDESKRWFDIHETKNLVEETTFDPFAPQSQLWTLQFCQHIRKQDFINELFKNSLCLIELLNVTELSCNLISNDSFARECCEIKHTAFPFNQTLLMNCLSLYILKIQSFREIIPMTMDRYFLDTDNKPVLYEMTIKSNIPVSPSFHAMDYNYRKLAEFMKTQMASAPSSMNKGWFAGYYGYYFQFYDLQLALSYGTFYSVLLSLGVASLVMMVTTLNLLLTLYAILTISLAIAATVACIVFMGWELNVIESVTISLAVGLSIDFTIHYGVAYRISDLKDPPARVHEATMRVGSAVAMAALTTFCAGAAIMPCCISGFTKLGTFLMLVMVFSWLYATFFFQGLCRVIGPRGRCCQVPSFCCRKGSYAVKQPQLNTDSVVHVSNYQSSI